MDACELPAVILQWVLTMHAPLCTVQAQGASQAFGPVLAPQATPSRSIRSIRAIIIDLSCHAMGTWLILQRLEVDSAGAQVDRASPWKDSEDLQRCSDQPMIAAETQSFRQPVAEMQIAKFPSLRRNSIKQFHGHDSKQQDRAF